MLARQNWLTSMLFLDGPRCQTVRPSRWTSPRLLKFLAPREPPFGVKPHYGAQFKGAILAPDLTINYFSKMNVQEPHL
jgi:hypothetical protein